MQHAHCYNCYQHDMEIFRINNIIRFLNWVYSSNLIFIRLLRSQDVDGDSTRVNVLTSSGSRLSTFPVIPYSFESVTNEPRILSPSNSLMIFIALKANGI